MGGSPRRPSKRGVWPGRRAHRPLCAEPDLSTSAVLFLITLCLPKAIARLVGLFSITSANDSHDEYIGCSKNIKMKSGGLVFLSELLVFSLYSTRVMITAHLPAGRRCSWVLTTDVTASNPQSDTYMLSVLPLVKCYM